MGPRQAPRPTRGRRATKLGKRLTAARLAAGLTQAQLAAQFGVTVHTVTRWETGATKPVGVHLRIVETFLAK